MKTRQALAQYRQKKFLIQRFARTYKYIIKLLRGKGFHVADPIYTQNECYRGRRAIFACAEQIGPGIVGTLYCCANCKGYPEVMAALTKDRKIPKNAMVRCMFDTDPLPGILKPIILYPILKKPINKPFYFDIPAIVTIIQQFVLGGKKSRAPKTG